MRFHQHLSDQQLARHLAILPKHFTKDTPREQLALCLGATLYTPGTRTKIAEDLLDRKYPQLTSLIIDLEDAVADSEVEGALRNTHESLLKVQGFIEKGLLTEETLPLLFVRVRTPKHLERVTEVLGETQHLLTGYVLPKFELENGAAFLHVMARECMKGYSLYAMPVLETANLLYKERRLSQLTQLYDLLKEYQDMILNVRIGATDFLGVYGIRRKRTQSVYDVLIAQDMLTDIVNVFGRQQGFAISGAVWEYFDTKQEVASGGAVATKTLTRALEGLAQECELDQLNGLVGKTVIHPTHIQFVNASYIVTYENYLDALAVLDHATDAGVLKSSYGNKMNEMKPHQYWAKRILARAEIYGVLKPEEDYLALI
ncbi:HpcH/HpaI aldolase/citrate lyase family protein [Kurthia massiliensis]|uniref:HpcH/HpaI aldolase/citrate lyase family protein n=1 Tax=Kurthia massiliensis TaxID=1033739 RepID=UPI000289F7CE|nr:HpcH/HpaI aldolase/citrate lyase family protein [Kurthia massiliensis]